MLSSKENILHEHDVEPCTFARAEECREAFIRCALSGEQKEDFFAR